MAQFDLSFLDTENLYENFANVFETLDEYRREFERVYKLHLEENGHKATGNLISSISTYTEVKGDGVVEVWLDCAEYYRWVDKGRSAGKWPPRDKILDWIRVKPIIPRPDKNGKLPTEQQLAFLIQRKIGEEGTEGTGDLQHTLEELNGTYMLRLQEALAKDWQKYADGILNAIGSIRL